MFDTGLAGNGYAQTARSTGAPRQVEYKVFSQVTRRLSAAISGADTPFAELAEAMHENLKLWLVIASDLRDGSNELPVALKSGLLNLAEFTRVHTARVLEGDGDAAVFIEINTAVMRGLRGDTKTGLVE
ncbi:MAG: flagellar biosynthesis regulator FlaF [Pseudomonadota bacterium]